MHTARSIFISLCITVLPFRLFSQPAPDTIKINFETFSIKDGLSQGFVLSVIQDKEGYMWFATKDGLNKYDGYHVTVYRNNPDDVNSLPDNFVTQLAEDSNGNFWVGTSSKGLCLFDKRKEKFYPVPLALSSSELKNESIQILQCRNGKLRITTRNNTLVFDVTHTNGISGKDNFKSIKQLFNYNELQKSERRKTPFAYPDITWINDGELWAAFPDSIYIFSTADNSGNWMVSGYPASRFGMDGTGEFTVAWSDKDKVILNSSKRIVVYDFKKNQVIHSTAFTNHSHSGCYAVTDMHNNLLIENGGQYRFDTHTYSLTPVVSYPGFIRNCIPPGFIDRTGILWIGSNTSTGILKYDERKEKFRTFYFQNSYTYFQTPGGEILFCNNGTNALFNYKTGKVTHPYTTIPANCYDWNYKVQDRSGNCYSMISEPSTGRVAIFKNNLKNSAKGDFFYQSNGWGRKLFFDRHDELWGLLESPDFSRSIARYDKVKGNKVAVYRLPIKNDANEYIFISDFWQDEHDVFWFATLQGLFSFNETKKEWHQWKNKLSDSTSLSADMLFSVCPDPKEPNKYLWIGTNGAGFNRFEFATGRCIRYSEKDGLPNNVVYGILSDQAGNLWMSTNKGLSCFKPGVGSFRNFTESDGLQGDEFNRYQSLKLKSGELLFGGVNGITAFNPADVLVQNPAPNVVLTGFSVFNKPVNYKNDSSIMNAHIGYVKTITLPYHKNMFSIEFAALESSPAEKKQYKYLLEGFNKEWIDNGSKNTVSFTNLDPGQYTFHVTGTNRDGVWSKNEASVIINILPPWWGTWWFRILVALSVAGAIYALYRYRLRQVLKLHDLRNNIARDLHDEIGSTLSSISLYGESAKMMIPGDHPLNNVLTKISNSTNNMMESMSDIVWTINTRNDQFDNLINRMNAFAYQVMETKNCKVNFETNTELSKLELNMEQRKNLYLIYKEIVNNAARHSSCNNLLVTVFLKNNLLDIGVKDDGKGFSLEETGLQSMGGNGLINIKKRAADLKASLNIQSLPGQGTEVILKMKL
ncbi:MAG: triple tyrosine motif-containing protein [Bacteroidia bacterium]